MTKNKEVRGWHYSDEYVCICTKNYKNLNIRLELL